MGQQPTVQDVARTAGVSRQTVSNVVNSPSIVKAATRARVEAAISHLGYRPNLSARRLRQQKSATIGVGLHPVRKGISEAVLDRFVHALTEQADARSMRVLLYTADNPQREIEQLRRLNDAAEVDAVVLTSTFHGDPRTEWLIENGLPFVTFGRPWGIDDMNDPKHLWVDFDGRQGVRDATTHLIAEGATRISWVGWPSPSGTGDDRRRGWEVAMREHLAMNDAELATLRIETGDNLQEATEAVATVVRAGPIPDAIVCASDTLALGALIATSAARLADVPIIGFDNTPVAEAVGLSSVEQESADVASAALELLLGPAGNTIIRRELAPAESHRLLSPTLIIRRPGTLPIYGASTQTPDRL